MDTALREGRQDTEGKDKDCSSSQNSMVMADSPRARLSNSNQGHLPSSKDIN